MHVKVSARISKFYQQFLAFIVLSCLIKISPFDLIGSHLKKNLIKRVFFSKINLAQIMHDYSQNISYSISKRMRSHTLIHI